MRGLNNSLLLARSLTTTQDLLWDWFPTQALTPLQRWNTLKGGALRAPGQVTQDLASWIMGRRMVTKRQVEEMMVDFWGNLFHIAPLADYAWLFRGEYWRTIRDHAIGGSEDLLMSVIQHPCLGLYLDNVESTRQVGN